jgi:Flp pilus assembly protein TadG
MQKRSRESGNQTLEFTLVGIPIIFLMFSIANMSFAMLTMHTMQEAVEQGGRYVVTRGSTCSSGSNTCSATVQQIAGVIAGNAVGISQSAVNVSLIPASGTTIACNPLSTCLSSCGTGCNAGRANTWPPSGANAPGQDITITADYNNLPSPMFMMWPGPSNAVQTKTTTFHAYSRQRLMF